MKHLSIDIETYSDIDLPKAGLYKYAQSPNFEVLLFAYSVDFGEVQIVDLARGEKIPKDILEALYNKDVIKHAYNAAFEWYCLSTAFPQTFISKNEWLEQWRCTLVHGLYCGYTAGLAATGEAIGLPQDKQKMGVGKSLITYFCKPCKPTQVNGGRTRNLPKHDPDKWNLFKEYCKQDVVTEMAILNRLSRFDVPESEWKLWRYDLRMNAGGVRIDRKLVENAVKIGEKVTAELKQRAIDITGLQNPNSTKQLMKWLEEEIGEEPENLQKATVVKMLDKGLDSEKAEEVLKLRQKLGKTSTKKYDAMLNAIGDDGRARGFLQFYGANRTGRWAGRIVQVQNLPRNYMPDLDFARELVKKGDERALKFCYGNISDVLSQLVRTAFIPKEGCKFVVADFSAIEARVIAWLAGEEWRQKVFSEGGDIYCASASQMFKVPVVKHGINGHLRQKGKIAELALGYGGNTPALVQMGALDMGIPEEELPEIVSVWRNSNPKITTLWNKFETAAVKTVKTGGSHSAKGIVFRYEYDISTGQEFLTVQLPSKRRLYYAKPKIAPNRWGKDSVHYYGINKNNKWGELETYGGKLTENIVQAIARDCLAFAMLNLEENEFHTVMHIHDECVMEVPENTADLEKACRIMSTPIPWAKGLLLNADGFVGDYYKKD